jgi:hypothetical protein
MFKSRDRSSIKEYLILVVIWPRHAIAPPFLYKIAFLPLYPLRLEWFVKINKSPIEWNYSNG